MKRNLIIATIAILVLALGIVAYLFLTSSPGSGNETVSENLPSGTTLPSTTPKPPIQTFPLPPGDTFAIGTGGGSVTVKNFYKNPVETNAEQDAVVVRASAYEVVYFRGDTSFLVTITAPPFADNRILAEQAFIDALGITQSAACKLKVFVSAPYWADPVVAGQQFPLSFCMGGVK